MDAVESEHWWFVGKRLLFRRLLADRLVSPTTRLLDVGCGTGAVAADFGKSAWVCATDRSQDALRFARSRGASRVLAADAPALPFRDGSFDIVTAFDIVEHVDEDAALIAELGRVLRPGGALAIHVPAWPSLWSGHDEILQHKRRYTRRSLRRLIEDSPLRLAYLGWASCAILAPAALARLLRPAGGSADADLAPLPAPLNQTMIGVYRAEAAMAASIGLPFGLSLAAIAVADDSSAS